jgi:hypothetical protein
MPITYENIATTTLSSASSTITFSSIPSTFTDLRLVVTFTGAWLKMPTINSDTGANYSATYLFGSGSSVTSVRSPNSSPSSIDLLAGGAPNPALVEFDFLGYQGSTNKTFLIRESGDQNGSGYLSTEVATYASNSAITSITITSQGNMGIGTTATLYGIKNA